MKIRVISISFILLLAILYLPPSPVFAYYPKVTSYKQSGSYSFSGIQLGNLHPDNCGLVIYGVPEKLRKEDALEEVCIKIRVDSVDNPANEMYIGEEKNFSCEIEVGVTALPEDPDGDARNDTIGLHPSVDSYGLDGRGTITYTWKFKEEEQTWQIHLSSRDISAGQANRGQIKLNGIIYGILPAWGNELQAGVYDIEYIEDFTDVFQYWESSGAVHVMDPSAMVTSIQLSGTTGDAELVAVYDSVSPPVLWVSHQSLSFSNDDTSATINIRIQIRNTGEGTLIWSISSNRDWLAVSPNSGSTTMETDSVSISINRAGLSLRIQLGCQL